MVGGIDISIVDVLLLRFGEWWCGNWNLSLCWAQSCVTVAGLLVESPYTFVCSAQACLAFRMRLVPAVPECRDAYAVLLRALGDVVCLEMGQVVSWL